MHKTTLRMLTFSMVVIIAISLSAGYFIGAGITRHNDQQIVFDTNPPPTPIFILKAPK